MRSRAWLLAAALTMAAHVSPMLETVSAQGGPGIVISEFRLRGPSGANDEFIELYNAGSEPVNVGGWLIRSSNNVMPPAVFTRATIPAGTVIEPGCYYLAVNVGAGGYSGSVAANLTYSVGFADDGGVGLTLPTLAVVDQVGLGANAAFGEGTRLTPLTTNVNRGYSRLPGGAAGHADTNDNAADFAEVAPSQPQNASSPCVTPVINLPHEIQGGGSASPLTFTVVTVRGVVTARTADGFFVQTEAGSDDADPQTSEGLFVSTPGGAPAAAAVGHLVHVTGTVTEFAPAADPSSPPVTQLSGVTSVIDQGVSAVPEPYVLTPADLSDLGTLDQLERLEGMRVTAPSLTSVSATALDGAVYTVLTGQPRPFREPGVASGDPVLPCSLFPCNIPIFDGNPERLRVDTDGLEGTVAALVASGAVMTGLTGPLGFDARTYTLLPESPVAAVGGLTPSAAPAAAPNQFTVASLNLGTSSDVAKASLMVRHALNLPDIVALHGVAADQVAADLASRIDVDELAAGNPAPAYQAHGGAGVAYLTKAGRVQAVSVEPAGADATFVSPDDGSVTPLFAHPPLVLRALVTGPSSVLPQAVTLINNDLGGPVGARRQAQAEFLANDVQNRQINDPAEALLLVGQFNAPAFNDGYVDVIGTIRGLPATPDQVALASPDVVSPDLADLAEFMAPADRYSSVTGGNAQAVDHVLASANVAAQVAAVVRPRVNADFPEVLAGDATTPLRLSGHDPAVVYVTFPPDRVAPVFTSTPQDVTVAATSGAGAVVNFLTPDATDNLDPDVDVTCAPASGSTFPVGNSGVTCTAQDEAGNTASVSFTVSVLDPQVPGRMVGGGIAGSDPRVQFAFDVAERASGTERGWLMLMTRHGPGRPNQFFAVSVEAVSFSDGDGYAPGRWPASGVDTVSFSGVGWWNGRYGYRYDVTASDRGEPGVRRDTFNVVITAPDGTVVANAGGPLAAGNVQSLR